MILHTTHIICLLSTGPFDRSTKITGLPALSRDTIMLGLSAIELFSSHGFIQVSLSKMSQLIPFTSLVCCPVDFILGNRSCLTNNTAFKFRYSFLKRPKTITNNKRYYTPRYEYAEEEGIITQLRYKYHTDRCSPSHHDKRLAGVFDSGNVAGGVY